MIGIPLGQSSRGMFVTLESNKDDYIMNKKMNKGVKVLVLPYWRQILIASILSVFQSGLQVLLAVVMKFVIDTALSGGNLLLWGCILAANLLAILLFYLLEQWFAGTFSDKLTAKFRADIMHAAVCSRDSKLQMYHSGEMLSRGIEDANTVSGGAMSTFPALIGQVTRLAGSFIAVLVMQPVVALILLIMAVLMSSVASVLRPAVKERQRIVREAEEKVSSNMQEDFQQLELIQSLQAGEQIQLRFDQRLKNSLKAKFRNRRWAVSVNGAVAGASYLGTGAVLLWGAGQLIVGAITYGDLTSVLELLSLFRGPVLSISGQWNRLVAVEVACDRLMELLDLEKDADEPHLEITDVEAVVFENVTFRYSGEETTVVENFNATFPLNGWTCLTGISGKGKTTLFKLMLGLYAPQQGRVYLKTSAGEFACSEQTRHLFAYVPQDYAMLSGTVLENLQLVAPDVTEETYRTAIDLADANFIWDTAAGIDTHLGENNTGLSKGQLQRLAIARAILMDRKIFLLDECTSALDAQTEDTVLHNLKKLNKSAILVTHRPQAVEELENVAFVPMDQ